MTLFNIHGAEGYTHTFTPSQIIDRNIYGNNMGNMFFYGSVYNAIAKNQDNIVETGRDIGSINKADYYLMPQANLFYPGLFIKTNKKPLKQQVNTVSAGFALSPVG